MVNTHYQVGTKSNKNHPQLSDLNKRSMTLRRKRSCNNDLGLTNRKKRWNKTIRINEITVVEKQISNERDVEQNGCNKRTVKAGILRSDKIGELESDNARVLTIGGDDNGQILNGLWKKTSRNNLNVNVSLGDRNADGNKEFDGFSRATAMSMDIAKAMDESSPMVIDSIIEQFGLDSNEEEGSDRSDNGIVSENRHRLDSSSVQALLVMGPSTSVNSALWNSDVKKLELKSEALMLESITLNAHVVERSIGNTPDGGVRIDGKRKHNKMKDLAAIEIMPRNRSWWKKQVGESW